jgi:hypothetical protein
VQVTTTLIGSIPYPLSVSEFGIICESPRSVTIADEYNKTRPKKLVLQQLRTVDRLQEKVPECHPGKSFQRRETL